MKHAEEPASESQAVAGSVVEAVAEARPWSARCMAGPYFEGEAAWLRYGVALGLLTYMTYLRVALSPLLGTYNPLLPFILPVFAAAYLCGRGPALLVALLSPIVCTPLFQPEFRWSDPLGWLAHVGFFLLLATAAPELIHRLQRSYQRMLKGEARLRLAAHSADIGVFEWRLQEGQAVWDNGRMYEIFGRERSAGPLGEVSQFLAEYVHPDDAPAFARLLRGCDRPNMRLRARCRIRRASDGQWRRIEFLAITAAPAGNELRLVGVVRDLTEEMRAREKSALLEAIVTSSGDAISSETPDGRVTSWNAAAEQLLGYDAAEMLGRSIQPLIPGELQGREQALLKRLRERKSTLHYETDRLRKDGSRLAVATTLSPIMDSAGKVLAVSRIDRDVTEQRRTVRALAASEQRLRQMADAMPEIVFVLDADRNVQYLNRTWREYTGLASLEPQELRRLIPESDLQQLDAAWRQHAVPPQAYAIEFRLRSAQSGELRWFLARTVPVLSKLGQVEMWIGTAADIHEQRQAQLALLEADRRKNEFLAMLAHELRNPLAPILNVASILQGRPSDAALTQQVSDILKRQTSHLARLVDDLLDVARITRDKIRLQRETLLVQQVVDRALESVHPLLIARSQAVKRTCPPRPIAIEGDAVRLTQVIGNLLSNASKFSAEGATIFLTVEAQASEVSVRVRDQGIGIDRQVLPLIFELFVQGDQSLDRSQGGLGIGLTVAKRLVELHGGRIEARSEGPGRGSELIVTLPRTGESHHVHGANGARSPASRKILVVDDNADAAMTLLMMLETAGHEARAVHDGAAALRELEQFDAELVLLDIGLPELDGYAVAELIRQRYGARAPRIVALSGYGREENRQVSDARFDAHLTKPVDGRCLIEIIDGMAHPPSSRPLS